MEFGQHAEFAYAPAARGIGQVPREEVLDLVQFIPAKREAG
jgi:hypothetical protein